MGAVAQNRRNERHNNDQCGKNGCHGKFFLSDKYRIIPVLFRYSNPVKSNVFVFRFRCSLCFYVYIIVKTRVFFFHFVAKESVLFPPFFALLLEFFCYLAIHPISLFCEKAQGHPGKIPSQF